MRPLDLLSLLAILAAVSTVLTVALAPYPALTTYAARHQ